MKNHLKKAISKGLFLMLLISIAEIISGQALNDECRFATFIQDVEAYCSDPMEFSNEDGTQSTQVNPSCWPQNTVTNDVWFSFKPKNLGALIQLTGQTVTNQGTIDAPAIAIYSGDCGALTEVACNSVLFNENVIELTLTDLTIGRLYYIRVDGRDDNTGNFRLCINTFSPVKSPESDCIDGVVLCNKDEFFVEKIEGVGDDTNEVNGSCIQEELASVWYKWTCDTPGSLTFSITPNNRTDDIDFAVYELTGGLDGCGTKRPIRCMASGETIGNSPDLNSPCFGATGLSFEDTDTQEDPGCQGGDNNFVRFINMEADVSYALVINNFSQSGSGFSISWGGTGTFKGPKADFETEAVGAFECDKTILFYNTSTSDTDPIDNFVWSFGEGANPPTENNTDTVSVIYDSFGDKTAAITVESSRGCIVTKVLDFFVEPCCQDTSNLTVFADGQDLICPDIEDGIIEANGIFGNPAYQFSLDGENYQPNPRFINLGAAPYIVYIVDEKGCVDTTTIIISSPPPLIVDAGPDQEIELGESTTLEGSITSNFNVNFKWDGEGFFDTLDMLTLDPSVLPPGDYTYTLNVIDEFGCTNSDEVTIRVRIVRPVYSPNIFSPSTSEGINDFFNLFGGPAVENVQDLYIYDRWGNLMYKGRDLEINNDTQGWDGKFDGELVNPGVYTWAAKVLFIDGVVLPYGGDVTIMR